MGFLPASGLLWRVSASLMPMHEEPLAAYTAVTSCRLHAAGLPLVLCDFAALSQQYLALLTAHRQPDWPAVLKKNVTITVQVLLLRQDAASRFAVKLLQGQQETAHAAAAAGLGGCGGAAAAAGGGRAPGTNVEEEQQQQRQALPAVSNEPLSTSRAVRQLVTSPALWSAAWAQLAAFCQGMYTWQGDKLAKSSSSSSSSTTGKSSSSRSKSSRSSSVAGKFDLAALSALLQLFPDHEQVAAVFDPGEVSARIQALELPAKGRPASKTAFAAAYRDGFVAPAIFVSCVLTLHGKPVLCEGLDFQQGLSRSGDTGSRFGGNCYGDGGSSGRDDSRDEGNRSDGGSSSGRGGSSGSSGGGNSSGRDDNRDETSSSSGRDDSRVEGNSSGGGSSSSGRGGSSVGGNCYGGGRSSGKDDSRGEGNSGGGDKGDGRDDNMGETSSSYGGSSSGRDGSSVGGNCYGGGGSSGRDNSRGGGNSSGGGSSSSGCYCGTGGSSSGTSGSGRGGNSGGEGNSSSGGDRSGSAGGGGSSKAVTGCGEVICRTPTGSSSKDVCSIDRFWSSSIGGVAPAAALQLMLEAAALIGIADRGPQFSAAVAVVCDMAKYCSLEPRKRLLSTRGRLVLDVLTAAARYDPGPVLGIAQSLITIFLGGAERGVWGLGWNQQHAYAWQQRSYLRCLEVVALPHGRLAAVLSELCACPAIHQCHPFSCSSYETFI